MSATVIGQICTSAGLVQEVDGAGTPFPYRTPANRYLRAQPIAPVHLNHANDWKLGEVIHYDRSQRGGLLGVAYLPGDVEDLLAAHPWSWSDGVSCRRSGPGGMDKHHVLIRELSLVGHTANIGTRPVYFARGDIADGIGAPTGLPLSWRECWSRAAERASSARYRLRPDHLDIFDVDRLETLDELLTDPSYALKMLKESEPPPPPAPNKVRTTRARWRRVRVTSAPSFLPGR